MGKKDNNLDTWKLQYPSTAVSWRISGDESYASLYIGTAKNLLYAVKNRMKLGQLGQLSMTRHYPDGTIIQAKSVFGQNVITITVQGGISCQITLKDVPSEVPPMMWYAPGEETFDGDTIRKPNGELEIEGIDYVKTYYSFSMNCPTCTPRDFTLGKDIGTIDAQTQHRPFIYKSEADDGTLIYTYDGQTVPHFMGYDWSDPTVPPDPLNHTIYSFYAHAESEIVKFGSDNGGSYFLWKAYTEWSNVGPDVVDFSRTGLGYMLMKAFIKNNGVILCESKPTIVKVDCCLKPQSERQIKLWWEEGSGSFMFYGSTKLYEVPETIPLWAGLYYFACIPVGGVLFYSVPDVNGACLPIEWTVEGRGSIEASPHPTDQNGYYICPDPNPYQVMDCADVIITAEDRCGTKDSVRATCCDYENPDGSYGLGTLAINYTSLFMALNAQQTLQAVGGCPPYSWGGGCGTVSIDPSRPAHDVITYTAPASNPNCAGCDISVTDCCGSSTSIHMSLTSPYYPGIPALFWCGESVSNCTCIEYYGPDCIAYAADYIWTQRAFDCYGTLISEDIDAGNYGCTPNPTGECPCPSGCMTTKSCGCRCLNQECNTLKDVRTAQMIADGCCPLNPLTGLPY